MARFNRYALAVLVCLTSVQLLARPDQNPPAAPELFAANVVQGNGEVYDDLLELAYQIQKSPNFYKSLNTEFAEYLTVPLYLQKQYGSPKRAAGFSTTQLVLLLKKLPELQTIISDYLKKNPEEKESTARALSDVSARIASLLKDAKIVETIRRMGDITQPLAMIPEDGGAGYNLQGIYVNHPRLRDPNDPNSEVIPADNLVQQWVQFIDGARSELWLNSYEFSHPSLAEAVVRAIARGVRVRVGIDKNTLEHKAENKQVWELFSSILDSKVKLTGENLKLRDLVQSIKKPDFILTAVNPLYINHQKIAARDTETENAGALISSGNLTPSCLDPRGMAYARPEDHFLDGDRPNANHLIVVKGKLPAMIIRFELKKTIIDKLRGAEYPISGAYILYGEKKPGMDKPPYLMMTFSPNGGLGEINRDIFTRLILGTKGPVIGAQYAFASDEVLKALIERARRDKAAGRPFDFSIVGETNFLMQPYSSALLLAGYKFNTTTHAYEDEPSAEIRKILTEDEISQLREKINTPPATYDVQYIPTADGKKFKEDPVMHHKLWLFAGPHISTPGTSFNTSKAAEGNQEQILVTNDVDVFQALHGGIAFLQKNAEHSLSVEVKQRNDRQLGKKIETEKSKSTDDKDPIKSAKKPEARPAKAAPLCDGVFANAA